MTASAETRVIRVTRVPEDHPVFTVDWLTGRYRWFVCRHKSDLCKYAGSLDEILKRADPLGYGESHSEARAMRDALNHAPTALRVSSTYARAEAKWMALRADILRRGSELVRQIRTTELGPVVRHGLRLAEDRKWKQEYLAHAYATMIEDLDLEPVSWIGRDFEGKRRWVSTDDHHIYEYALDVLLREGFLCLQHDDCREDVGLAAACWAGSWGKDRTA